MPNPPPAAQTSSLPAREATDVNQTGGTAAVPQSPAPPAAAITPPEPVAADRPDTVSRSPSPPPGPPAPPVLAAFDTANITANYDNGTAAAGIRPLFGDAAEVSAREQAKHAAHPKPTPTLASMYM